MRAGKQPRQRGFAYLAMLFALAVFGAGLATVGQLHAEAARREREAELIRVGTEIRQAIAGYYYSSPGGAPALPESWVELLEDRRYVGIKRHLRKIPLDPMTQSTDWGIVRDREGRFMGVHSRSSLVPFRSRIIEIGDAHVGGQQYSDWQFVFDPYEKNRHEPIPPLAALP